MGVTLSTFKRWLELGRSKDPLDHDSGLLTALAMRYDLAKAEAESFFVGMVKSAMPHDWRAAKWMLETHFPEYKDPHDKRLNKQISDLLAKLCEYMSEASYKELTYGLYLLSEGEISSNIEIDEEEISTVEIEIIPSRKPSEDQS